MADLGKIRRRGPKPRPSGLRRVLRLIRIVLLALLVALVVGLVIGTLIRKQLDEPIHYYGGLEPPYRVGAPI